VVEAIASVTDQPLPERRMLEVQGHLEALVEARTPRLPAPVARAASPASAAAEAHEQEAACEAVVVAAAGKSKSIRRKR